MLLKKMLKNTLPKESEEGSSKSDENSLERIPQKRLRRKWL